MVDNKKENSVVVTGIGLVTPVGVTIESFWQRVKNGMPQDTGGRNPFFEVNERYNKKGRFIDFALTAAISAVKDAGIQKRQLQSAGITISSSKGGINTADDFNHLLWPHMAGVKCAEYFGCTGPLLNTITACATGLNSIIIGAGFIKTGRAKLVISGGTDACLSHFLVSAYKKLGVLSGDYCRPYDKRRNGFILSEGAAVVVLEEKNHAISRGAKIYGEVTGCASLCEGYHITSINPDAEAIAKVINLTCKNSKEIDYINTHGTGTVENDRIETQALKKALGEYAPRISISSTKAVTGHMLGAGGAAEFIVGILAIQGGFIPPTANLNDPDPLCDLDYTPKTGRKRSVNKFLTLSYGFGGHVCAVEVSRPE